MNNKPYYDVVIVGAGPAGLFAAYNLAKKTDNIIVVDSGKDIYHRSCPLREGRVKQCVNCSPCNIMQGFGGAGTFSDCKLSLTPYGVGGDIIDYISNSDAENYTDEDENIFASFDPFNSKRRIIGKDIPSQLTNAAEQCSLTLTKCPTKHLGTDGTLVVMRNLFEYLKDRNVQFCFGTKVTKVEEKENPSSEKVISVYTDQSTVFNAKNVIFAVGRSGNHWLKNVIAKDLGIKTVSNKVDVGVRVEVDAEDIEDITYWLYDMKFSKVDAFGNKVRTFCTNPRGYVSEEHYDSNTCLVNGHSFAKKKSNRTNFALLVTLNNAAITSDYVRQLIQLKNSVVGNKIMVQDYCSFAHLLPFDSSKISRQETNTLKTAVPFDMNNILPSIIKDNILSFMTAFARFVYIYCNKPMNLDSVTLYGLEAKFYSDRIEVDNHFETAKKGIYAVGDGSGITRGIVQSCISGMVAADNIITNL
nr:hypothetical protein YSBCXYJI_YSBCXYJI_CDS_0130 [Caudoviricetes sp.]